MITTQTIESTNRHTIYANRRTSINILVQYQIPDRDKTKAEANNTKNPIKYNISLENEVYTVFSRQTIFSYPSPMFTMYRNINIKPSGSYLKAN